MSFGLPMQSPILVLQVGGNLVSKQALGTVRARYQRLVSADLWRHCICIVAHRPRKLLRGVLGQKDQWLRYAMSVKLRTSQLNVSTRVFNQNWN